MAAFEKRLSSRLLSLLKNRQWETKDVVQLFKALVENFNGRNDDFHTWMMKNLHEVEIHKISMSDFTLNDNNIYTTIDKRAKNTEKTLDDIIKEISEQTDIDEQTIAEVKDIVSAVSNCLSASTAPHLKEKQLKLFQLCKAAEKVKYKPQVTQMVSWCILVLSKSSRLIQVGTGEGKSCIVAMFAAYQVMMGKTPDIISSSAVLAERDAKEWSAFYKKLKITVDVNTNKSEDEELKKCYECQVVYGTNVSFAADWLRQRVNKQDVRPKREFQCVIVDEVDSLMLDKGLEVVYLSTEFPLMESLNGILAEIWHLVNKLKHVDTGKILGPIQLFSEVLSEIIAENKSIDQLSIVQMAVDTGVMPIKFSMQTQKNMRNVFKSLDNASVWQIVDFLTKFVKKNPEYFFILYQEVAEGNLQKPKEIGSQGTRTRQKISVLLLENGKCCLVHCENDTLVRSLGNMIKKVYQSEKLKKPNESRIPGLQDLINGNVQTWIENALLATKINLENEYILRGDGVVPVDYESTGVVQNDMTWGEGLHQFLEMKHQTKLSNMHLITNFMSNVGLFQKYKNNVYGLTGTLGDQTELDMLKKLYEGITTCKIPLLRQRKLYELEGMVIHKEDEWIRIVCKVVKHQVSSTVYRGPRAALVICETISWAKKFHETLADTVSKDKVKLYVNNNMDNSKITDSRVQAGDIIVATNLAGRGTDLKVCESVNEAGGLFVLQTFLPLNVRVEQQAFGRTARQGSPGSAQIITCREHLSDTIQLNMPQHSLPCPLDNLLQESDRVTESLFEDSVNKYLKNRTSQNHEVMISALTGLLNSFLFRESNLKKAKDTRNSEVQSRLSRFFKDITQIKNKEELFSVFLGYLDIVYECDDFSDKRDVIVSSLHEFWGLWLLVHFSEEKNIEMLKVQLSKAMWKCLREQSLSSTVYMRTGNSLRSTGRLAESIEMYTKALKDGACGKIIPLYNRALATIMKKDAGYIAQALDDLEKADKEIDSYKSYLTQITTCVDSSQKSKREGSTLLTTQFKVKHVVVNHLKMNIQDSVMKLKRAQSRGGNVSLTEKLTLFVVEDIVFTPWLLKELTAELMYMKSLGLHTIFSLDTIFSLSGFLSKTFKLLDI